MVKTKLKPILSSLREKKRYVVFEVISKEKIADAGQVSNALQQNLLQCVGEFGAANAGMIVLNNKWNSNLQRGIIKVSHKHVDALKASFIFAEKISNTDVICRSLGVSGILKKAESNYLNAA